MTAAAAGLFLCTEIQTIITLNVLLNRFYFSDSNKEKLPEPLSRWRNRRSTVTTATLTQRHLFKSRTEGNALLIMLLIMLLMLLMLLIVLLLSLYSTNIKLLIIIINQ